MKTPGWALGLVESPNTPLILAGEISRRDGEAYFSPAVAARLSAAVRGDIEREQRRTNLDLLTGREREVLAGIAKGLTNKEIASELGISHRTVETHRESLMKKLGIRTVAGLTKFSLEAGLLQT